MDYIINFQEAASHERCHLFIINRLCEAAERHVLTKSHVECAVGNKQMIAFGRKER
jgi:hypothetical protein